MNKKYFALILALLVTPVAFAAFEGVADTFNGMGGVINEVFQNPTSVYIISFLLFFILLYAIFSATAKVLPIFKGEGSSGVNKAGKMFAVALSLLATFGIFFSTRGRSPKDFLTDVLGGFGFTGALFIGGAVFAIMYMGTKDVDIEPFQNNRATISLLGSFISLMLISALTNNKTLSSIVSILLLLILVKLIVGFVGGGKKEEEEEEKGRKDKHDDRSKDLDDSKHDHDDLHKPAHEPEDIAEAREWPGNIPDYDHRLKNYLKGSQFYKNYHELAKHEKKGRDFWRTGYLRGGENPDVSILCIHGGDIAFGAERIAYHLVHAPSGGHFYKLYIFKNERSIRQLPIEADAHTRASGRLFLQPHKKIFNDPTAHQTARMSKIAILIDTFKETAGIKRIVLSGKNDALVEELMKALISHDLPAKKLAAWSRTYAGVLSANRRGHIVNLCEDQGAQIQISQSCLTTAERPKITQAIKEAIANYKKGASSSDTKKIDREIQDLAGD